MRRISEYNIKYRIVWITENKAEFLVGKPALRTREIIRYICKSLKVNILSGHVRKNCIELVVSCPPNISVSKLVQRLKGGTSRVLLRDFPELQDVNYNQRVWTSGYLCLSIGTSSDKEIEEYIRK